MKRPRALVAIATVGSRESSTGDAALTRALVRSLDARGFDVTTAESGDRALELFREIDPAVVILEVLLPGLNGYQLCRQLRIEAPHTPTLLFSSRRDPADRVWAEVVGARQLLRKPEEVEKTAALAAELAEVSAPP